MPGEHRLHNQLIYRWRLNHIDLPVLGRYFSSADNCHWPVNADKNIDIHRNNIIDVSPDLLMACMHLSCVLPCGLAYHFSCWVAVVWLLPATCVSMSALSLQVCCYQKICRRFPITTFLIIVVSHANELYTPQHYNYIIIDQPLIFLINCTAFMSKMS